MKGLIFNCRSVSNDVQLSGNGCGHYHDMDWFNLLSSVKCPVLLIRAKCGEAVSDKDFAKMQALFSNVLYMKSRMRITMSIYQVMKSFTYILINSLI